MKDDKLLNKELGFNIKSYMGNAPTLLNSSMATNFVYEIEGYNGNIEEVNNIETKSKIRDRILYLIQKKASIKFIKIDNLIFNKNLRLVDTLLPEILSIFLLNFYSGKGRKINEVSELLFGSFLDLSHEEFIFKVKSFLLSIALGMVPTKTWDGFYSADGYIVVKNNGDIGCFSVLDKKILADYLYDNTKFDTPSSSRHDYGYVYKVEDKFYIKLNLQIRF
jgi:type II restriction enzyme